MQINHREEYEKLIDQFEVDKSSILRTKKGKVFVIELVDREHHRMKNDINNPTRQSTNVESTRPAEEEKQGHTKKKMITRSESKLKGMNEVAHALNKPHAATLDQRISRENSFVRQSSMLSEISQPVNVNALADLLEKNGFNCENAKQESFNMGHKMLSKNSSFVSNGGYKSNKKNSFLIRSKAKYGVPMHDARLLHLANDKYFEGIDDDEGGNNNHQPFDYGKHGLTNERGSMILNRDFNNTSIKFDSSMKLEEQPSFLFNKKQSFIASPEQYPKSKTRQGSSFRL